MTNYTFHDLQIDSTTTQLDRIEAKLDKLLERKKPKKTLLTEWIPPKGVSQKIWDEYLAHRKEKGQKVTERAYKMMIKKLMSWSEEGVNLDEVLLTSITNGYTGIFKPHTKATKQTNNASVEFIADNALNDWAARNGAPAAKNQIGYDYDRYRADLIKWERSR